MRFSHLILFAGTLFFVGCGDGSKPKPADNASGKNGTSETKKATFSGIWMVIASRMDAPREVHLAVIKLGEDKDGKYVGKVLDSSDDMFPAATLAKTTVSDDSIQLEFKVGTDGQLNIHGLLAGDTIYGNARTVNGLQPFRLVRTDQELVEEPVGVPTEGAEEFEDAMRSDDSTAQLKNFAKKFNTSPTALSAYIVLLAKSKQNELKEATVSQIIEDFVKTGSRWGARMKRNVRLDSAAILVQQKYLPDLAVKTLLPLEKESDNEEDEAFTSRLIYTSAMAKVISTDKETRATGAVALTELHEANLFDHRLRVALAIHHDQNGDKNKAMQLFAELAILPEGERYFQGLRENKDQEPESAEQAAARLWKSTKGEAEGLDEFHDQVYGSVIHRMFKSSSAAPPANPAGKRVSLCELFTGAACPPCVAADMATVGLEANYPTSSLIVLRYHQHIPLPDPLANADAETRFAYYEAEATPTVVLNGTQVQGIGGEFVYSQLMYEELSKKVDRVVGSNLKISIQLSANAKDGKLSLSAKVNGTKDLPQSVRLKLVLAEGEVHFDGRNEIKRHEMVVRYMPGGPDGIAPNEDSLSYEASLELGEIKQELVDYLDTTAKQYDQPFALPPQLRQQMPNGPFPVRPLDLKPLHLIAFVQDDASQEVLQAAIIPVSGKLEYPETAVEPITPPAPEKDDPNSPIKAPVPGSTKPTEDGPGKTPTPKPGDGDSAAKPKAGPKLIPPGTDKP